MFHQLRRLGLLCLTGAIFGYGGDRKLSPELAALSPSKRVDVIIQHVSGKAHHNHLKVLGKGGLLRRNLEDANASVYSLEAASLRELAADPDIEYISGAREVKALLEYSTPAVNATQASASGWTAMASAWR